MESPQDALAITEPARKLTVEYKDDAVLEAINITKGYSYFIQELGKHSWDLAVNSPITLEDVRNAKVLTLKELDNSFFKVRLDRAEGREKKLMYAMASLGQGPYLMADVAKKVGIKVSSLSPTRAKLISKGFIYTSELDYIDFTVPLFDDFLRRNP